MSRARPSVLQVVLSLGAGGTERLVIDISRALAAEAEVHCCCLDAPGEWAGQLAEAGIGVSALARRPGFRPGLARRIAAIAAAQRATVLHCHHYTPFVYGYLASLLRPATRVVYTEHGRLSDAPPSAKRRLANALFGRTRARVFAVSEDLRRHMIAEGFPAARVAVVHNGIDPGPPASPARRAAARAALGVSAETLCAVTVARLDPVKDLATMLEGLALARAGGLPCTLTVIGDGPERAALERRASAPGLAGAVTFLGQRDDVRALLPAFDLYLNSSVHEGVSVTILEAMAASLPVVATAVGGNPEVVAEPETGLLVPARSPERLAAAIGRLATDPEGRQAMGAAARRRLEQRFSFERMLASYRAAYAGEQGAPGRGQRR